MDLTIPMGDTKINIRVAVIMETSKGFVLQKNSYGDYYFFMGGRLQLGQSSLAAAQRETFEESGLNLKTEDFQFVSIIENFWESPESKYQEFCFVYKTTKQEKADFENALEAKNANFNPVEITKENLKDLDIRPEIIKRLILENKLDEITHHIV